MIGIGLDLFGNVVIKAAFWVRRPEYVQRAYEGWCPVCPERLKVTLELPDSPQFKDAVEAAIGEQYDTSLLTCTCCDGVYCLRRGDAVIEYVEYDDNWLDGYIDPPCKHIGAAVASLLE